MKIIERVINFPVLRSLELEEIRIPDILHLEETGGHFNTTHACKSSFFDNFEYSFHIINFTDSIGGIAVANLDIYWKKKIERGISSSLFTFMPLLTNSV